MNVAPIQPKLNTIQRILSNPKAAAFAQNTVCAIAVETTLKATGRPLFIYHDKNANPQSKKYAANSLIEPSPDKIPFLKVSEPNLLT